VLSLLLAGAAVCFACRLNCACAAPVFMLLQTWGSLFLFYTSIYIATLKLPHCTTFYKPAQESRFLFCTSTNSHVQSTCLLTHDKKQTRSTPSHHHSCFAFSLTHSPPPPPPGNYWNTTNRIKSSTVANNTLIV